MLVNMDTDAILFGSEWPESCNTEAWQDTHLASSTVSHPGREQDGICA